MLSEKPKSEAAGGHEQIKRLGRNEFNANVDIGAHVVRENRHLRITLR
jgi:hypothetical protein